MAYLVLSNGTVFEGKRIGAHVDRIGELVFTTGMEGYLETLTDPSYYGQIVTQTFPLIGNYGVIEEDFEGNSTLFGYIVRELCDTPSNFRSAYPLNDYLVAKGIPGLCGVDTREIVRITREEGVMNAMICDEVPADLSAIRAYAVTNAVDSVTEEVKEDFPADGEEKCKVALIDYGAKHNIIRSLQKRGCSVTVWPARTTAETILASGADGIMLSNGPGDPKENVFCIGELKKLIGKKPRQQRNMAGVLRRPEFLLQRRTIAQYSRFLQNKLSGTLGHGASAVKNLGHSIAGQSAGVRNILHGNSFRRHRKNLAFT